MAAEPAQAGQRESGSDDDRRVHGDASALAFGRNSEEARAAQQAGLEQGHEHGDGQGDKAEREEEPDPAGVHAPRSGEHLTPGASAGEAQRSRGPPRRPCEQERQQHSEAHEEEEQGQRFLRGASQRVRPRRDGTAEEVGRARAEGTGAGNGEAAASPALGPLDGLRPLGLEVGTGWPVVDASLQLAPATLELDPRELLASLCGIARDRPYPRTDIDVRPASVVAAHAFGGERPRCSASS